MASKAERRERMRQRAAERQSEGGGGREYLNLPEGVELWMPDTKRHKDKRTHLDVLMYPVTVDGHPDGIKAGGGEDSLWPRRPFLLHRDIGPEKKSFVCPKSFAEWPRGGRVGRTQWLKAIDAACPVCEEFFKLADDEANWEDPDRKKIMTALRPTVRELYNVVPLDEKEPTICVFDYSWHWFGTNLDQCLQEGDDEVLDFAEFKGGQTLAVTWRASDLTNRDGDPFLRTNPDGFRFEKREDYDPKEWGDEVALLDEVLVRVDYAQIESWLQGVDAGEARGAEPSGGEDASRPRRPSRTAPPDEPPEQPEEGGAVPDGHMPCVACDGGGKTPKGNTCPICDGAGSVPDDGGRPKEPEQPASPPGRPTRRRRAEAKEAPEKEKEAAPAGRPTRRQRRS